MKIIKSIITLMIITSASLLYSQEPVKQKPSLLIYNFNVVNMTTPLQKEESVRAEEEKQKNYQYYSFIIPQTISKNLSLSNNYLVNRKLELLSIKNDFPSSDEKRKYFRELKKSGTINKADYLITGNCRVYSDRLEIDGTIFNVRGRNVEYFTTKSFELGVLLKETTDIISDEVNKKILDLVAANAERFRPSPFKFLEAPLGIMSIGLDTGYYFILGDWADIYNDALYMSPFLKFDINRYFTLSLSCDYLSTNTDDKDISSYSDLDIKGASMGVSIQFPVTENFIVGLSAEGGLARTTITVETGEPFTDPLAQETSTDPCTQVGLFMKFKYSSFDIDTGVKYKRIFLENKALEMAGIYAGLGIHF